MRKIFYVFFAASAVFLSACGDASPEKLASTEYVKAALKVSEAAKAFNSADYMTAKNLCIQAKDDVDSIIKKYPESSISLKVVTDGDTRIGNCSFSELREKIIPQLEDYSNTKIVPISLAWAIAISQKDKTAKDAALKVLSTLIIESYIDKSSPFNSEASKIFVNQCVLAADSASLKSELISMESLIDVSDKKSDGEKNGSTEQKSSKSKLVAESKVKIDDAKLFISQAKTEASLVAYDLRALESLKNRAAIVAEADKSIKDEFLKILDSTYVNAEKISIENVRSKALSDIALAFSRMGENAKAVRIAANIKNPEKYSEMFSAIAENAGRNGSYVDAIAIASKLPSGVEKEKFLTELASALAKNSMFAEAVEVTKLLSDSGGKNRVLAVIAKAALSQKNSSAFANAASKIDLNDSSAFLCFSTTSPKEMSKEALDAEAFAKAASLAVGSDDSFAALANSRAEILSDKIASKKDFAKVAALIASTSAKLGKGKEALKFLTSSVHRSLPLSTYDSICELASIIYKKDSAFAIEAFSVAADICKGMNYPLRAEKSIILAYNLIKIDMPRKDAAKVLADFLPKFAQ